MKSKSRIVMKGALLGLCSVLVVPACSSEPDTGSSGESGGSGTGANTATGGDSATGGGASGGTGTGGNDSTSSCPAAETPPIADTACSEIGQRCAYSSEPMADYLCTSEGVWIHREYVPAEGGAGGEDNAIEQPDAVYCGQFNESSSCNGEPQCRWSCCDGGFPSPYFDPECERYCCDRPPCFEIPGEHCPAGICKVQVNCRGQVICRGLDVGSLSACGRVGSSPGQEVECCSGLLRRCGMLSFEGACLEHSTPAGYAPICLACGDGTCEGPYENPCSCPEDCGEP